MLTIIWYRSNQPNKSSIRNKFESRLY